MTGTLKTDNNTIFYPFSPGIPWHLENNIIIPEVSKNIWNEFCLNKTVYILCSGYLLEILLLILFDQTLKRNGINQCIYIVPKKYENILQYFKMKIKVDSESDDLFMEFIRLKEAAEAFPSPIFMDRKKNIYFNSLFNYGEIYDYNGDFVDRNNEPFWKQLLKNTCCFPYSSNFKWFDKNLIKNMSKNIFKKYKINENKPYIIIDNNYINYTTADSRASIAKTLAPHQLKAIGATFGYKQYQCVVSTNKIEHQGYFVNNINIIPSWYNMNLFDWLVLVTLSSGIYSSDPNIYLSAALIGCNKIFAGANYDFGWELEDAVEISDNTNSTNRKWVQRDNFTIKDIVSTLI